MGADVFMTSIEVITSKEQKVVRKEGNTFKEHHVRVWNATIANLSLMALGSSAPEILLSIIEIVGGNFYSGALGPSTIVGSAAFNLMIITAVCIVAIPAGETRTIKQLGVFMTTAAYSILAYIWLLIIVVVWTPNVIRIEEGVLTVIFLFILIMQAYFFDQHGEDISKVLSTGTRAERASADVMEMSSRHSRLKFHDAASVLKNKFKESGRPASVEEIANVLQSEVEAPPKTKAHYRREVTKRLGFNPVIRPNKMISAMGRATVVSLHLASSASGVATGKSTKTKEVSISIDKGAGKQFSAMLGGDDAERSAAGVIKWTKDKDQVSESDGVIECIVERVGGSKGEVSVQYHTKDQTAMGGKDYETVTGELTWADGDAEPKTITIKIIDDDTYEKDEEFTVVLTEPKGGATFPQMTDGGAEEEIMTVTILNDDERAMALRQALMMINIDFDSLDLASSDWASQIKGVFEIEDRSFMGRIQFALSFPWKLMFAVVPPPGLCGGWPCFVGALIGIAVQVVLISDFASQMGCQMSLKDEVTAITFVALGTSLPDTFASVQAARGDKTADNSIGNVTGSNSVNVFFGLGLPWLIAAIYWQSNGQTDEWRERYAHVDGGALIERYPDGAFVVLSGSLGFSVTVFTICAIATISIILCRRFFLKPAAELGGNKVVAWVSATVLVVLWSLYVVLSALKCYENELGLAPFGF